MTNSFRDPFHVQSNQAVGRKPRQPEGSPELPPWYRPLPSPNPTNPFGDPRKPRPLQPGDLPPPAPPNPPPPQPPGGSPIFPPIKPPPWPAPGIPAPLLPPSPHDVAPPKPGDYLSSPDRAPVIVTNNSAGNDRLRDWLRAILDSGNGLAGQTASNFPTTASAASGQQDPD